MPEEVVQDSKSELRSREIGEYLLREYIAEKGKRRQMDQLESSDIEGLATVISWFALSSEEELRLARQKADFQATLALARTAFESGVFPDQLVRLAAARRWELFLSMSRRLRDIETRLLVPHIDDLKKISSPAKVRLVRKKLLADRLADRRNATLAHRYTTISSVLESIPSLETMILNEHSLRLKATNQDTAELLTFAVLHPENGLPELEELSPHWETYPLKWHVRRLSMDRSRLLFQKHARGEDLSDYFVKRYSLGSERIFSAINALPGVPVLRERSASVHEAISAYDQGLYRAALCLSLTIIEGLLWDFASELHRKFGDLEPTPSEARRIRDILQSHRMSTELDECFIRYFCDELYPERNPMLHGRVRDTGHQVQAAQKLATLEYLLNVMGGWLTKDTLERLPSAAPDFFQQVDEFLETYHADSKP